MALSRIEHDLNGYAQHKLALFLKDVQQSFEIAEVGHLKLGLCITATLMRGAALLAQGIGMPRAVFLEEMGKLYDCEQKDAGT